MGKIGEIFRKLNNTLNSSTNVSYPKLTPNEVELNSYKEQERLDKVKQDLLKYREKNAMLNDKGDINVFKKQPSLLVKNNIIKKSNLAP
jgi:hypothetical protein